MSSDQMPGIHDRHDHRPLKWDDEGVAGCPNCERQWECPPSASRLENYRREIPQIAAAVTQLYVDNPGQFVLLGCGSYVLSRALINVVRPRGVFGVLAVGVVSAAVGAAVGSELVKRGVITIRVRDAEGALEPLFRDA